VYKSLMKKAALALTLVASAAVAQAATFNIGALSDTYQNNVNVSGSFEDTYTFTLPSQFTGLTGSYFAVDYVGMGLTTRLTVGEFGPWARSAFGTMTVDLPINSNQSGLDVASYESTFNLTPGGSYWFKLSGYGEAASYTVTLAPVPEPETYALLLAGLGLMGAVARRRQSK
jgi:hypothetical protein